MAKKKYTPSPAAQARRAALSLRSQEAKALREKLIQDAATPELMERYSMMGVNDILIEFFYKIQDQERKPAAIWKKEGFKIKAGSKGFTIWGAPRKVKEAEKEVEPNTEKEEQRKYKLFPMCILFCKNQVETWEDYKQNKSEKTEISTEKISVDKVDSFPAVVKNEAFIVPLAEQGTDILGNSNFFKAFK